MASSPRRIEKLHPCYVRYFSTTYSIVMSTLIYIVSGITSLGDRTYLYGLFNKIFAATNKKKTALLYNQIGYITFNC